jgi:hypothetical protein
MAISRNEIRRVFRQALQTESAGIRLRFDSEDEALRFRKACYNYIAAVRKEKERSLPDPRLQLGNTPLYDIKGNLVAIADVMRLPDKAETEFDCLHFRINGCDLIIQALVQRVLDGERPVYRGVLPAVQEVSRSEIEALPPWPLRSPRRGRLCAGHAQ